MMRVASACAFLEAGGALGLHGLELGLHLVGVLQAGVDLARPQVHGREDRLDGEVVEDRGEDQEADRLDQDDINLQAEFLRGANFRGGGEEQGQRHGVGKG
jgi:hypothetical protein